ncbi:peptidase inhibitor family I36 protein [Streptomyces niveus]|nr:peptidase inhibitor family I36 protein [Streptomyces niveus]
MLSVVGLSLTAPQAQAAKSDCYAGAFCAYTQDSFAGTPGKVYENNTDLTGFNSFAHPKSIYNHGNSCDVTIYTGKGYTGSQMTIERGDAYTLGSGSTFRLNGIASNKWVNCR